MRISTEPCDPGFVRDQMAYRVFVDGVESRLCITADEEAGLVVEVHPAEARRRVRMGLVMVEPAAIIQCTE